MTPNTTVTLYATPFDISNKYVIAAASEQEALGIVSSYPSRVYTDCYWQRDNDWVFRANGNINEVEQYNYCVFLNNGKYNFAFITEFTYVNDAMTLVHLVIDPWLNYAGDYIFHDSPMKRCHIPAAWDQERIYNAVEPYEVAGWYDDHVTFGDAAEYEDTYKVFLVTKVPANSYDNTTVGTFYRAYNDLINNGAFQSMTSFWVAIQPGDTDVINIHPQAPTYLGGVNEMELILRNFLINGRSSDIIGAYYVPEACLSDHTTGPKSALEPKFEEKELFVGSDQPYWLKAAYSPQFKRIYICNCGNTHYLPVEEIVLTYLTSRSATMKFNIGCDPSMNGSIYAWPNYSAMPTFREHLVTSMPWDKVQVTGYGVDVYQQSMNQLESGKIMYEAASGFAHSLLSLDLIGTVDAVANATFDSMQNRLEGNRIAKSGSFTSSSGSSSMACYNLMSELVTFGVQRPKSSAQIYRMFGTFGYTLNGEVVPITFKDLPYWKYYMTQEAAIEGRKVPQRYLTQIINRFNAGIFIFNDVASYKDFSNAWDNHY